MRNKYVNNTLSNEFLTGVKIMKRFSIVVLIVLSFCFIIGCKTSANNNTNTNNNSNNITNPPKLDKAADYLPLTKGSTWEYEGEGNEYASFKRKVLFTKDNLAQTSDDNGGTVMTRVIETSDNGLKILYFQPEDYQPSNLLETNFTANSQNLIIKNPIQVGTNWNDPDGKKEIVSLNAVVDSPLGKFDNCLKIKITTEKDTSIVYQYFQKGVGMVKQEFVSGDTIITSTLKNFKVE